MVVFPAFSRLLKCMFLFIKKDNETILPPLSCSCILKSFVDCYTIVLMMVWLGIKFLSHTFFSFLRKRNYVLLSFSHSEARLFPIHFVLPAFPKNSSRFSNFTIYFLIDRSGSILPGCAISIYRFILFFFSSSGKVF